MRFSASSATLACLLVLLGPAFILAAKSDFDYDSLSLREVGARNTLDWRVWLLKNGNPVSFWHDIPLYPDEEDKSIVNMYVEIPRWTDGKIETARNEPLNPIFHDDKKGLPRFVYSVWPHKTYPFNYGSFPQTWEDSTVKHNFTGYVGDNDPLDVFDISSIEPAFVGQVKKVKILGGLAMIDEETTDWKAIVVDVNDPLSKVVNTVDDLEKYRPGMKKAFYDWFVYYKVIKGDGLNTITGNKFQAANFTIDIISESHDYWVDLVKGKTKVKKISTKQTSNPRWCKSYVASENASAELDIPTASNVLPPAQRPVEYDHWYYLDDAFQPISLQD